MISQKEGFKSKICIICNLLCLINKIHRIHNYWKDSFNKFKVISFNTLFPWIRLNKILKLTKTYFLNLLKQMEFPETLKYTCSPLKLITTLKLLK